MTAFVDLSCTLYCDAGTSQQWAREKNWFAGFLTALMLELVDLQWVPRQPYSRGPRTGKIERLACMSAKNAR
jgi:hypothetical protein